MAIPLKVLVIAGFTVTIACLIALIISFSSDKWVVSKQEERQGFDNIGLWSVCFDQFRPPPWAYVDRYYDNCWWVFDKELDDIRDFLIPSWFVTTQSVVTVALVLELIIIIIVIVKVINCFPYNPHQKLIKYVLVLVASIMHFIAALLLIIGVILFAVKADNERTWLEKPEQNYLSWSYGFCILAAFLAIIAGMCLLLEFWSLRSRSGDLDNEPRVYLTNQPPPSSNYIYGRNIHGPVTASKENSVKEPAYAQRYGHGSQSSLTNQDNENLFKVNGSGQVYINRLHDYEDRRYFPRNGPPPQRGRNGYHPQSATTKSVYSEKEVPSEQSEYSEHDYDEDDYEKSKKVKHPTIPEYVPKSVKSVKKKSTATEVVDEDSDDLDRQLEKKRKQWDSEDENKKDEKKKRGRSSSRDRKEKSWKQKTNSSIQRKSKKKRNISDDEESDSSRRKSKRKGKSSRNDSDDERSRKRRSSKKGSSSSTRRRNRSRDTSASYSESNIDSDEASTRGRSKRRNRDSEFSRSNSKRRSHSEDSLRRAKPKKSVSEEGRRKKGGAGHYSDDQLGSEYSSRRSRRATNDSDGERKKKSRDFSDTESVRSRQRKPKGTYSSFYE